MKWNSIIEGPKILSAADALEFMRVHPSDCFLLVDVRQPQEYTEAHLPGAVSAPLDQLVRGDIKLENKPIIVYCRSGGRSKAAAQWLMQQNYSEVYDIGPNIGQMGGEQIAGSYDANVSLIEEGAEYPDAFVLAYQMEEGLRQFYLKLAAEADKAEFKLLFERLASFEVKHKERLLSGRIAALAAGGSSLDDSSELMEGGYSYNESALKVLPQIRDLRDIFGVAMGIETQSLDLYSRLAQRADNEKTRELFFAMADEEKQHLTYLAREMDKYLG